MYECPKACNLCRHTMPRAIKCQRDPAEPPILQSPGGLNRLFESIVNNPEITRKYNTTVVRGAAAIPFSVLISLLCAMLLSWYGWVG